MNINAPTLATACLMALGIMVSIPVLATGFRRRGTGIKYESSFAIQRAPQVVSLFDGAVVFISFFVFNQLIQFPAELNWLWSLGLGLPRGFAMFISWMGVVILCNGLVFMIGGWISLGECFSTDAELLGGHTVHQNGLLKYVMHPAYSGIIQLLTGASLAAVSPISLMISLFIVAPMWLKRAKYEEQLLIENLGDNYLKYARQMKWRRFIPIAFPFGI